MNILWAGPYFSEYAFTKKRALNIASTVWSHGFVKGLSDNGAEVEIVTICPEQAWPRGRVLWQSAASVYFDHDVHVTAMPYLNVAYIREVWQSVFFAKMVKKVMAQKHFDAFVCYNVLHPYHVAAMKVAKDMGVKVYPIILDGGYDPTTDNFTRMSHDARYADGVVFLSRWGAEHFPAKGRRILQMEGGVDTWRGTKPSPVLSEHKFVVTYAGAITPHRGQQLAKMVRCCKKTNIRFIICGKWDMKSVQKAFGDDPRVELRGMVSTDELQCIYSSTDIFVNSRDKSWGHNLVNFPSKVSAYISYGRPIVSNWVDSFPEEYRELLCVSDDDGESMARVLDQVLNWSYEQRLDHYMKLQKAYDEFKSWKMQARRFLDFVQG